MIGIPLETGYGVCFVLGLVAGYTLRNPLRIIKHRVFSGPSKMMLVVREDLKMTKGKTVSQACHAACLAYRESLNKNPTALESWEATGQPKVSVKIMNLIKMQELQKAAEADNIIAMIVRDAGRTQLASGTETVLALGPDKDLKLNKLTRHLKLL